MVNAGASVKLADRFAVRADTITRVVDRHWPEQIDPADLGDAGLADTVTQARGRLLEALDLGSLA